MTLEAKFNAMVERLAHALDDSHLTENDIDALEVLMIGEVDQTYSRSGRCRTLAETILGGSWGGANGSPDEREKRLG